MDNDIEKTANEIYEQLKIAYGLTEADHNLILLELKSGKISKDDDLTEYFEWRFTDTN